MGDSKEEKGTEDSVPERRILINGNPFLWWICIISKRNENPGLPGL